MLVNGKWSAAWHPVQAKDAKGGFVRQTSSFRHWITPDGSPGPTGEGGFPAEPGRYHLYVALICPWASRTLIARALKRLEDVVSVTVLEPALTDQGWRFGDDRSAARIRSTGPPICTRSTRGPTRTFTGRATVPVLWDRKRQTIVNNESADILRMLNAGFGALADDAIDLYPEPLRAEIDALNERMYPRLNNGVYRAGFATTQVAYEEAFGDVFAMLDELEDRLDSRRFLVGDRLTESDIRAFVTPGPVRRRLLRPVQMQPPPDRRLSRTSAPTSSACWPCRGSRDGEHRPHQARLLLDQGAEPERHRAARAGPALRSPAAQRRLVFWSRNVSRRPATHRA